VATNRIIALVDDWDMIPGARGCTPQTCAFRDLFAELKAAGAAHVFGLSTQSNTYPVAYTHLTLRTKHVV